MKTINYLDTTACNHSDILFDDFSILRCLANTNKIVPSSRNTDCDCDGFSAPETNIDYDSDKIAKSVDKTD